MVVEDILDLDQVCFTGDNEWDHQFRASSIAKRGQHDEEREAARIEEQLDRWREMLPVHLTPNNHLSPLPHVIIGLAVSLSFLLVMPRADLLSLVARYRDDHASLSICGPHTLHLVTAGYAL